MKKVFLFFIICFFYKSDFACTTFCINKNGQIIFGRNYDWITGEGIVNTNQRGLFKTSMSNNDGGVNISWTSTYGSITFNQYGKEFPTGGMNEKGLVVELMWLDETVYPVDDKRPSVGVLQWIQYQLDNSSTVVDVINSDSKIRISKKATPLHYLIADAGGNVATIEFLDGKMIVHKDEALPFPVLTNDTYASSILTAKPIIEKKQEVNLSNNSLDRFVKACGMVQQFKENNIAMPISDFAFSILDKVAQGDYTKWSIVYDITNKAIRFKTADNKNIKLIQFSAFDFSCSQASKMFHMNQETKGDVSEQFTLSDKKIKQQVMSKVVAESSKYITVNKKEEEEMLTYEEGIKCK